VKNILRYWKKKAIVDKVYVFITGDGSLRPCRGFLQRGSKVGGISWSKECHGWIRDYIL